MGDFLSNLGVYRLFTTNIFSIVSEINLIRQLKYDNIEN